MYVVSTKTAITKALKTIFDGSYPEADFRSVNVSIEFPMQPQNYPGIWVQFEDGEELQRAGIDHREIITDSDGIEREITRWRFGGTFAFTVAAMSSLERDRLYDELVRVIAFSGIDESPAGRFRELVEENDLIGINLNFDVLTPSGDAATPGTPWDTNEVIYEKTLSVAMIGEFVSDASTNALIPLSKILVAGFAEPDLSEGEMPTINASDPYTPGQWI